MEQISEQIKIQDKISKLVRIRQEQISELKLYYDSNNTKYYKDIVKFGPNLSKLNYIKNIKKKEGKTFITKLFEKNNSIPLTQNELIKERVNITWDKSDSFKKMASFYDALFKKDSNFFKDFNSYLTYQKDSKRKEANEFKMDDFNNKLDKVYSNSYSTSNKFYNRVNISFELDYASTVNSTCDIFFMIYNKMMDKSCYVSNLLLKSSILNSLASFLFESFW